MDKQQRFGAFIGLMIILFLIGGLLYISFDLTENHCKTAGGKYINQKCIKEIDDIWYRGYTVEINDEYTFIVGS